MTATTIRRTFRSLGLFVGAACLLATTTARAQSLPTLVVLDSNAIAVGLEKVQLPRPMTHDLFKSVMDLCRYIAIVRRTFLLCIVVLVILRLLVVVGVL